MAQTRRQLLRDSWARFVENVPDMREWRCAVLVWGGFTLGSALAIGLGWMAQRAVPWGAVLAQSVFVLWAGGWMYLGFWRQRAAYRARYERLAYRELFFRFAVPGLSGGVAAIYFPLFVAGERLLPPLMASGVATYLLLTAFLIEARGREIFWDIEWRTFVYSVFPERGRVVTSGIFQRLRHPVYSAAIRFTFALALLRNNLSAVLCAALIAAGVNFLARIEERDLIQRDAAYAVYRSRVPAFFVVPPLRFWRYLLTAK